MLTLMLQPYVPILLLIVFVVANAILMLGVSHVLSTYRRTPTKIACTCKQFQPATKI